MEKMQKFATFKFECPFKKGSNLTIYEYHLRDAFFSAFLPTYTERSVSLFFTTGKQQTTPVMSVTFYFMRVEVDD
jgi:hypothetical protein